MPFYGSGGAVHRRRQRCARSCPSCRCPVTTYGFEPGDAQVRALDVRADGARMRFTRAAPRPRRGAARRWPIVLNLPGLHNVRNALAGDRGGGPSWACADEAMQRGAGRLQGRGPALPRSDGEVAVPEAQAAASFTVIDDYGHHPVEMAATLAAARGAFPDRRIVLAFQPHRYTRTRDCFEDFVQGHGHRRRGAAQRGLRRRRGARWWRPTAARWRARCAWPARSSRCSWTTSPRMPQAMRDNARDGDVVAVHGRGLRSSRGAPARPQVFICEIAARSAREPWAPQDSSARSAVLFGGQFRRARVSR